MTDDPDNRHGHPPGGKPGDPPPPPPINPNDRHGHPLSLHLRIDADAMVGKALRPHDEAIVIAEQGVGFAVTQPDGSTVKVGAGEWIRVKSGDTLRVVELGGD